MFKVGELVVYGSRGVFVVASVGHLEHLSTEGDKPYYTLEDHRGRGRKVYVPVQQQKISLRRVITREETLALIERLPELPFLQVENEKLREQRYKEALHQYDCEAWMQMLKTLRKRICERQSRGKRATSIDERYLQTVRKCLMEELAVALNISREEVEERIWAQI